MKEDGAEIIRFDGEFPVQNRLKGRFSVLCSFHEDDFTNLDLEIFCHGDRSERHRTSTFIGGNKTNNLWLPNEDPSVGHLELLGITAYSTSFSASGPISIQPHFSAIQMGIHHDVEPEDRMVNINVRLTPSGLFSVGMHELHHTGEVKTNPLPWLTPILVKSEFGELLISQTFGYDNAIEFGNKITKQVPKSTITGEIIVPKGCSLHEVNEKLKHEINIWPDGKFIEGISEAAKIRNGLFHSSAYSDATAISDSLVRIRTLAERLIAKLIKWPDQVLWTWRDQELLFLNRQSEVQKQTGQ